MNKHSTSLQSLTGWYLAIWALVLMNLASISSAQAQTLYVDNNFSTFGSGTEWSVVPSLSSTASVITGVAPVGGPDTDSLHLWNTVVQAGSPNVSLWFSGTSGYSGNAPVRIQFYFKVRNVLDGQGVAQSTGLHFRLYAQDGTPVCTWIAYNNGGGNANSGFYWSSVNGWPAAGMISPDNWYLVTVTLPRPGAGGTVVTTLTGVNGAVITDPNNSYRQTDQVSFLQAAPAVSNYARLELKSGTALRSLDACVSGINVAAVPTVTDILYKDNDFATFSSGTEWTVVPSVTSTAAVVPGVAPTGGVDANSLRFYSSVAQSGYPNVTLQFGANGATSYSGTDPLKVQFYFKMNHVLETSGTAKTNGLFFHVNSQEGASVCSFLVYNNGGSANAGFHWGSQSGWPAAGYILPDQWYQVTIELPGIGTGGDVWMTLTSVKGSALKDPNNNYQPTQQVSFSQTASAVTNYGKLNFKSGTGARTVDASISGLNISTTAAGTVYADDNFSSFPDGWILSAPTGINGIATSSVVTGSSPGGQDAKSLIVYDSGTNGSGAMRVVAPFDSYINTPRVAVDFDVNLPNELAAGANGLVVTLANESLSQNAGGIQIAKQSGALRFTDLAGTSYGTIQYGRWYHVTLTFPGPGLSGDQTATLTDILNPAATYSFTQPVTSATTDNFANVLFSTGTDATWVANARISNLTIATSPSLGTPPSYVTGDYYPGLPSYTTNQQAIFWVSGGTLPGQKGLISGAFTSAAKTLRLAGLSGSTSAAAAVASSTTTVSALAVGSTALGFELPASFPQGPFAFRIEDAAGTALIGTGNVPAIQWVQGVPTSFSPSTVGLHEVRVSGAEAGGFLRIFGRDFPSTAQVTLTPVAGGTAWQTTVSALNSYALTVPIPSSLASGTYNLRVGDWTLAPTVPVMVYPASTLQVVDLSCSGLVGDGTTDNKAVLQTFLDNNLPAANTVVHVNLPAGTFAISSTVTLHPGQYLKGVSQADTVILGRVQGVQPTTWITGAHHFGLVNLTVQGPVSLYMVSSDSTESGHVSLHRVTLTVTSTVEWGLAEDLFLAGPDIQVTDSTINAGKYMAFFLYEADGVVFSGLTVNADSKGWSAFVNSENVVFENSTIDQGTMSYFDGAVNWLHPGRINICQNIYTAGVTVQNVTYNQREAFTTDGGWGPYCGRITSASGTTLVLANAPQWVGPASAPWVPESCIASIISGVGQGQYRFVQSANGNTIQLTSPWTVPPDSESIVSITGVKRNLIFYGNTARNAGVGVQIYGSGVDCTIANNTVLNSAGIQLLSLKYMGGCQAIMNVDIVNNTMSGNNASSTNTDGSPVMWRNDLALECYPEGHISGVLVRNNSIGSGNYVTFEGTAWYDRIYGVLIQGNSMPTLNAAAVTGSNQTVILDQ